MRYLKTMLLNLLIAGFLLPLLSSVGHAGEAASGQLNHILAAVLAAYGGEKEVVQVRSVVARGSIVDFMKDKQGAYARYYARPGKLRIEIMPEQGGEVRLLDGMHGWQGSLDGLREARPFTIQSMLYQYGYLDLPMGFADRSYQVSYQGRKEYQGRPYDLLHVEVKGAPQLRVFIDPETHLIARVAADFDMGMGSSELATVYEDFRRAGGVLFPYRLINYAGDMKLSVISITDLKVNADIPGEKFSPGTGKQR